MRAMILAAGRGERMRPLTDRCPKPLLAAGGKPLIMHLIERLRTAGITDLVVNHAHLGAMIEAALGDGRQFGVTIRYSPEGEALETAGGIRRALPLLGEGPFLALAGDVYCTFDPAVLADAARALTADGDLAHLLLVPNPRHHPAGDFHLGDGRVDTAGQPRLTYAGLGAFHPALFAGVRPGEKAALAPLLRSAMDAGRVSGTLHDGLWLDVGTPERLTALDALLRSGAETSGREDRQ